MSPADSSKKKKNSRRKKDRWNRRVKAVTKRSNKVAVAVAVAVVVAVDAKTSGAAVIARTARAVARTARAAKVAREAREARARSSIWPCTPRKRVKDSRR